MIFSGSKPSERVNSFSISSLSLGAFGLIEVLSERIPEVSRCRSSSRRVGVDLVAHHVLDVIRLHT